MADKLKRKELIAQYEQELDRMEDEFIEYISRTESMLADGYAREGKLKDELAAANRSWAAANRNVDAAVMDRDHARNELTRVKELLEIATLRHVDDEQELRKVRAQLSRARAALEPLRQALFPATLTFPPGVPTMITVPPQTFPYTITNTQSHISGPPGTVLTGVIADAKSKNVYVGANYDPAIHKPTTISDLYVESEEDKVDRLNEAGYSCATEKAKLEIKIEDAKAQCESYAGLS